MSKLKRINKTPKLNILEDKSKNIFNSLDRSAFELKNEASKRYLDSSVSESKQLNFNYHFRGFSQ
jgi:hypothetical protein